MTNENILLQTIEHIFSLSELSRAAKHINLNYNVFLSDNQLWDLLRRSLGEKFNGISIEYEKKIIANRIINSLLMKYYPCERTVKYALVNSLKSKEDTVLFEMPVLDSRIDVCRINGFSYAYEIKTELDSLKRLEKQVSDYSRVFEYVYVVIPQSFYFDVIKMIPYFCGISIYYHNMATGVISFCTKRKASRSQNIDPASQLQCLSQENLGRWLSDKGVKKIPSSKKQRIQFIVDKYHPRTINAAFKNAVKVEYSANWNFIKSHYNEILPIDLQAFFSSSIDPQIIYMKSI